MALAKEGPMMIFNCHTLRRDGITVTDSTIKSISLGDLDPFAVETAVAKFAGLARGLT